MIATESVAAVLTDLKSRIGGIATALVSRNGLVLFADLPEGAFAETFAIMSATILGAATTAYQELNRAGPQRIVVAGPDSTCVITESGENTLLVAVVAGSADPLSVVTEMGKFADLLKGARGPQAGRGRGPAE